MKERTVEVRVSVYCRVPTSRKRDKAAASMAMEARARDEVRAALDLSQFVTKMAGGVIVSDWNVTDSVCEL